MSQTIPAPNYTQIPNLFLDEILPQIETLAELKVLLVVARQTFGYHKKADQLSVSQLVEKTGLSKPSVLDGVQAALKRGILRRKAAGQGFLYALNVKAEVVKNLDQSSDLTSKDSLPVVVKNLDHLEPKSSKDSLPTKESTLKKVLKESTNARGAKFSASQIAEIYDAYPRKVGRNAALPSIEKALAKIAAASNAPPDAAAWLLSRVQLFAQSDKGNAGDFTPHAATWFNQARYHDDETEWTTKENRNGHDKAADRSRTFSRDLHAIAELESRVRDLQAAENGLHALPEHDAAAQRRRNGVYGHGLD